MYGLAMDPRFKLHSSNRRRNCESSPASLKRAISVAIVEEKKNVVQNLSRHESLGLALTELEPCNQLGLVTTPFYAISLHRLTERVVTNGNHLGGNHRPTPP
jgi:hypothetical protein